jgi:hypothetical protein
MIISQLCANSVFEPLQQRIVARAEDAGIRTKVQAPQRLSAK